MCIRDRIRAGRVERFFLIHRDRSAAVLLFLRRFAGWFSQKEFFIYDVRLLIFCSGQWIEDDGETIFAADF